MSDNDSDSSLFGDPVREEAGDATALSEYLALRSLDPEDPPVRARLEALRAASDLVGQGFAEDLASAEATARWFKRGATLASFAAGQGVTHPLLSRLGARFVEGQPDFNRFLWRRTLEELRKGTGPVPSAQLRVPPQELGEARAKLALYGREGAKTLAALAAYHPEDEPVPGAVQDLHAAVARNVRTAELVARTLS